MDLLLILYFLFISPKLLVERLRGKRHPALLERLSIRLPKKCDIWVHAVSVGEVKAAATLIAGLKGKVLLTTTTATGQAEAKKVPGVQRAYMPLDFTWVVRRFVKAASPSLFICVESDFWPNALKALKKAGVKTALVSAKMSPKSFKRFSFFSFFAKRLFSRFDLIGAQNAEYASYFSAFAANVQVTGNLKLDMEANGAEPLPIRGSAITISCTHAGEEEILLKELVDTPYTLILAPRHPERFNEVAELLKKHQISFSRLSEPPFKGKVLLIDQMGVLPSCYLSSALVIVAGSYVSHIGGHNVLEPALYGAPVIFGPHTWGQKELVARSLAAGASMRVEIADLKETILSFNAEKMRAAAKNLIEQGRGSVKKTLHFLALNQSPC